MRKQTFDGRDWFIGSNDYYYRTLYGAEKEELGKSRESLHRYVWRFYNGEIPDGYIVHHKDEDKSNNDISNLKLMESSEHRSKHAKEWHKDNMEKSKKNIDKIRPLASEWHKSPEGREWHKKHYEKMKDKLHAKAKGFCDVCGKEYERGVSGKPTKYCGNACTAQARRDSGIDDETRTCEWCGDEFTVNKYRKKKFCSPSCRAKKQWA